MSSDCSVDGCESQIIATVICSNKNGDVILSDYKIEFEWHGYCEEHFKQIFSCLMYIENSGA